MQKETAENRMPWVKMVLVAVGAALVALIGFPAFAYASFFTYGIPADVFIGAAYFVWLVLLQKDRRIANARAIISYQVGLPCGVVRMYKILTWLRPFEVLDFPVLERYRAATLDLPTSSERLQCSRDALRRYDERLVAINLEYREEILDTCFEI